MVEWRNEWVNFKTLTYYGFCNINTVQHFIYLINVLLMNAWMLGYHYVFKSNYNSSFKFGWCFLIFTTKLSCLADLSTMALLGCFIRSPNSRKCSLLGYMKYNNGAIKMWGSFAGLCWDLKDKPVCSILLTFCVRKQRHFRI